MNLKQFEAFYWIARLGSFHAAARSRLREVVSTIRSKNAGEQSEDPAGAPSQALAAEARTAAYVDISIFFKISLTAPWSRHILISVEHWTDE